MTFRVAMLLSVFFVSAVDAGAQAVRSSSVRVEASRRVELKQIVRIGQLTGAPQYLFSSITAIVPDPQRGTVYVGDAMDRQVRVFTLQGVHVRTLGRSGSGPAEFIGAPGFAVARDTILVTDGQRLHVFDTSGQHLRTVLPGVAGVSHIATVAADSIGWILVVQEIQPGVTGSTPFRRAYRYTFAEGLSRPHFYQEAHPGLRVGVLGHQPTSSHHGYGFVEAPTAAYEVRVFSRLGAPMANLRFLDTAVPVPASALRDYGEQARQRCQDHPAASTCLASVAENLQEAERLGLPTQRPVIGRVLGSASGLILVYRADLDPAPFDRVQSGLWELVRDDGTWLGRVNLPRAFEPMWLGENEVWGVATDEFDVQYVVGLRLRLPR